MVVSRSTKPGVVRARRDATLADIAGSGRLNRRICDTADARQRELTRRSQRYAATALLPLKLKLNNAADVSNDRCNHLNISVAFAESTPEYMKQFLPRDAVRKCGQCRRAASVCPSVCLGVCNVCVFCQNE